MFYYCLSLSNIYVSDKWNTDKVTESDRMFTDCINLPNFNSSKTDKTNAHYGEGGYLTYKASTTSSKLKKTITAFAQSLRPLQVEAAETPLAQGTSGTCTWTISAEGELVIKPTNGTEGTLDSISGWRSPWSSYSSKIKTAKFEGTVYGGSSCRKMFYECDKLTSIDFTGFNTSNVTVMDGMFYNCSKLTSLNLSNFNTSNVVDMSYMFRNCSSITSLDLSNFNTSKVIAMGDMFSGCSELRSLDLSDFNTSNVTNMSGMFSGCSKLTSLDLSSFDTGNVTDMDNMFYNCSSLTQLDLSNFDTSSVTTMYYMFWHCFGLTQLDLHTFDTSKVTRMNGMFGYCYGLTSLDVNNFDTSNVTNMSCMFFVCSKLTLLDLNTFNVEKVTDMSGMFTGCENLTSLKINSWKTSSLVEIYTVSNYRSAGMFEGCSSLTTLDLSNFDTSNVTSMYCMFKYCSKLTSLNISSFDTSNTTNMYDMFNGCLSLTTLDISSFDTSKVTFMYRMFYGCSSLTSLDLSNFNTNKVTNMSYMFYGCSKLTSLDISSFNTSNVTSMSCMFYNCLSLLELDLNNFNVEKVTNMGGMFTKCKKLTTLKMNSWKTSSLITIYNEINYSSAGIFEYCESLTSLDISNFNTSQVKDMRCMFSDCKSLTTLDVSNFNTCNVTTMGDMFDGCSSLTSLDLSNFNTSKVTGMSGMFSGCSKLTSLDFSNFDTSNVDAMSFMFRNCSSLVSLDLSNFNTSKVGTMYGMFENCSNLTLLDLSSFDISNGTWIYEMFLSCSKLSALKLGKNFKSLSKTNLPTPSPIGTEDGQYTGKWTRGTPYNHADAITASQLMNTFSGATMADTWYWEKNGQDPAEQTYTSISDRIFSPADFTPTDDMTQEQKDALATARDNLLAQYQTEDKDGNAGYWTHIDDNTDMYTFYVYDANINWNIWEEDIDGDYNTNHDIGNPYVLAADAVDKTAVITNTIPEEDIQDFGSLEITKQVVNWDDTDVEDPREFTFKVTLTDADGKALAQPTTFGDVAFTNGKATITLKDNETVDMGSIPAGYHYKVEEETPNGYTVTMTGQEGDIAKDTKATVLAVNKKDKPKEETPKYVDLTLTKQLTGNYEEKTGEYTLHLAFSALAQSTTYKLSNGSNFTSDDYGNADVEVTIKPDQKVVVKDLPVGAKYTITEEKGDYFSSYTITDSNQLGKINKSKDSNTEKNKALSTSQETADDGESVTVTFTNRIQDTQNLKLTKKVVNAKGIEVPDNGQYEVSIHFENMVPESSFNSSLGPIQADDEGVVDLTTYLKAGDEVNFSQVPVGIVYSFTESANDKTASYTIEDSNKLGKINQAKGENTTPQKDLATSSETVNKGEEATVTFYNAKATQGSIKLIKKDGNQKLEGVTFALAQEDGTTVATKTTDANGEVLFEDLDEGVYTVKETKTVKGHSLLSEPFKVTIPFTIKKDKATEKKVDVSKATLVGDTYYFYDLTYTIDNGKNLNLPKTGQDTQSYLLVTLAMAAIVGTQCWIVTSKKRKGNLGSKRGKHNKA